MTVEQSPAIAVINHDDDDEAVPLTVTEGDVELICDPNCQSNKGGRAMR